MGFTPSYNVKKENEINIIFSFYFHDFSTSSSALPSPIYQSLCIFFEPGYYKFDIRQPGRHWIRLYFCLLPNFGHDLSSAPLAVTTDVSVLMNNFTFKNSNLTYLFTEHSVNATSDLLVLTFIPSNGSVSFVNGIEVVSVPDELINDLALAIANGPFSGLSDIGLETMYRLNMGGPLLTPQNLGEPGSLMAITSMLTAPP